MTTKIYFVQGDITEMNVELSSTRRTPTSGWARAWRERFAAAVERESRRNASGPVPSSLGRRR